MNLDHERLDVYQVSLDFAAWSKELLARIVAMLPGMVGPASHVREDEAVYGFVNDYEYGQEGASRPSA